MVAWWPLQANEVSLWYIPLHYFCHFFFLHVLYFLVRKNMYYAMTSAVAINFEPIYQDTKMVLSDEPVNSKLAASSSFWYCCLWRSRSIHLIGRVWPLRTLRRLPVCRKTYKTMMKIFPKEIIPTRWHCSMTVLPILYRNNRDSCF